MKFLAFMLMSASCTQYCYAEQYSLEVSPREVPGIVNTSQSLGILSSINRTVDTFSVSYPKTAGKFYGLIKYYRMSRSGEKAVPLSNVAKFPLKWVLLGDSLEYRSNILLSYVLSYSDFFDPYIAVFNKETMKFKSQPLDIDTGEAVDSNCYAIKKASRNTAVIVYGSDNRYLKKYNIGNSSFSTPIKLPDSLSDKFCHAQFEVLSNGNIALFSSPQFIGNGYSRSSVFYAVLDRSGKILSNPATIDRPIFRTIKSLKSFSIEGGFGLVYSVENAKNQVSLRLLKYNNDGTRSGVERTILPYQWKSNGGSRVLGAYRINDEMYLIYTSDGYNSKLILVNGEGAILASSSEIRSLEYIKAVKTGPDSLLLFGTIGDLFPYSKESLLYDIKINKTP